MSGRLISWGYGRKTWNRTWKSTQSGETHTAFSGTNEQGSTSNPSSMNVGGNGYVKSTTGGGTSWAQGTERIYTDYPFFIFDLPVDTSGRSINFTMSSSYEHTIELRRIISSFNGIGEPDTTSTNAVSVTVPRKSDNLQVSFNVSALLADIVSSGNNYGLALISSTQTTDKGTTMTNVASSVTFDSGWNSSTTPTYSTTNVTLGNSVTITTAASAPNTTHTLTWSINGHSGTIATKTSSQTTTFTPSVATFAPYITDSTSATLTITCTTYVNDVLSGSTYTYITLIIPNSVVPTASLSSISDTSTVPNVTGTPSCHSHFGAYVFSKSILTVTAGFTGAYGSTIRSYSLTFNGTAYTYSTTSGTTHAFSIGTLPPSVSSSNVSYSIVVTDSRGRSSSACTGSVYCIPYPHSPTIGSVSAERNSTTNTKADVHYTIDVCPMPVGNVNKNIKTLTISNRLKTASGFGGAVNVTPSSYTGSGYYLSEPSGGYSTENAYIIRVQIKDAFTSSYVDVELPSASSKIIDISEAGGIAFNMQHPGVNDKTHFAKSVEMHDDVSFDDETYFSGLSTFGSSSVLKANGDVQISNSNTSPWISFHNYNDSNSKGDITLNNSRSFNFRQYYSGGTSSYYEYALPANPSGGSGTHSYAIMTTKDNGPKTYTADITSSGWSSTAPFSKTVTVNGILSTDTPMVDITSGTYSISSSAMDSYSCVSYITNANNSITLYCLEEKPTANFSIKLLVLR